MTEIDRDSDGASPSALSILVGSWNLEGRPISELDSLNDWLLTGVSESGSQPTPDIVALGFQEVVAGAGRSFLKFLGDKLTELGMDGDGATEAAGAIIDASVMRCLQATGEYVKVASVEMVGVYLTVFVRATLARCVHDLDCDRVRSNAEALAGKKGGVAVRFALFGSSLCFVNVHLPSGEKNAEARSDVLLRVFTEAFQARNSRGGERPPKLGFKRESRYSLTNHTSTFVFGDFNFRLDLDQSQLPRGVAGITESDFTHLRAYDQYEIMKRTDSVLKLLTEAPVDFPPTYKYKLGTGVFDESRMPAWTDRIFQLGSAGQQLRYKAHMRLRHTSDHRPVSAVYRLPLGRSSRGLPSEDHTAAHDSTPSAADVAMCQNCCGRPRYKHFSTCCTWCRGPMGPHARDCARKAMAGLNPAVRREPDDASESAASSAVT